RWADVGARARGAAVLRPERPPRSPRATGSGAGGSAQPNEWVTLAPPAQSAIVTVSGPSVVTLSAAAQLTFARFASSVTAETFVAVTSSVSCLAALGALPQVFVSLTYGIAGIFPPV